MGDPISLIDRTAIVTGASRGIGRGIARVFSEAGADLVLVARTQAALEEVAGTLEPDRTTAVAGDVRRVPVMRDQGYGRIVLTSSITGVLNVGSLGEPEDIGYAALLLASDGARYVTGQTIVVDGGQTLPEFPA